MNLMELALKHEIKGTPNGPYLYPLSVRGKKPFSLLTDDESSNDSDNSSVEEENLGMGAKVKCIYDNDLYKKHDIEVEEENKIEPKQRTKELMYEYKSRRHGDKVEYISREDAFEIQYAKDFEFFFGVPYRPYIRLSRFRFGKNMKYIRDLKQAEAVYKKYPRYFFNDPWPEIDVLKPIPYVKQNQPPKLVNERGVPIAWLDIIEKSKRFNVRKGNKSAHNLESQTKKEPPRTLGDAVVAWEVSSSLLNGDLPSIIGEDKKSRKQKRFSFVRDNIRGVAEEIESWTKCPVVQTEINKYLESSWKNIEKQISNKQSEDHCERKLSRSGSKKNIHDIEGLQKTSESTGKSTVLPQSKAESSNKEESLVKAKVKEYGSSSSNSKNSPPTLKEQPVPKGPPSPPSGTDGPPKGPPSSPPSKGPPPSASKGPPSSPPSKGPPPSASKGPPKGPPLPPQSKGPPSPPSGTDGPSKGPPSPPPSKGPPGPPSKGPPSPPSGTDGPPKGPPSPPPSKGPPPSVSKGPPSSPPSKGPPPSASKGPPKGKGPPLPKKAPPPKKG